MSVEHNGRPRARRRHRIAVLACAGLLAAPAAVAVASPARAAEGEPLVVAHRGESDRYPENTRQAFRGAVYHGADVIELDVRWTRTTVPVVMHDATMTRTTTCRHTVAAVTLTLFRTCRVDAGGATGKGNGEVPPTLHEALAEVRKANLARGRSVLVNIELKTTPTVTGTITRAQADAVLRKVDALGLRSGVMFSSFSAPALAMVRKAGWTGPRVHIFRTAEGWGGAYPVLNPFRLEVTADDVRAAQAAGHAVLMGANDAAGWQTLLDFGVDYLSTDHLAATVAWLETATPSPEPPATALFGL
jgi:glycerophosphoryl diester phosphodiesterase